MAPSKKRTATRRIITRSIHKKIQEESNSKSKCGNDVVYSTPRGKKYSIPKVSACPPAPKKKRLVLSSDYSTAAAAATKFFSHPDLDVFFLFTNSASQTTLESN